MVLNMSRKEKHGNIEDKFGIKDDSEKDVDEVVKEADRVMVEQPKSDEGLDELEAKLKDAEKKADENYDRYLRAAAELDNYRKRAAREKADAIKYGNENVLRDILPLLDGMDRALEHAGDSDDFEAFKTGLQMLREQLFGCIKKYGVEPIDSLKKDFDPNLHEAMMQINSDQYEDNKIVDEFEKGYVLNGRLLRPAKVSVCKRPSSGYENKNESEA
jgi:molecular chaperone GrpE